VRVDDVSHAASTGARAEFGRIHHPLARRVSRRLAPSVARAALRLPASSAEVRVGKADQFRQSLIVLDSIESSGRQMDPTYPLLEHDRYFLSPNRLSVI